MALVRDVLELVEVYLKKKSNNSPTLDKFMVYWFTKKAMTVLHSIVYGILLEESKI